MPPLIYWLTKFWRESPPFSFLSRVTSTHEQIVYENYCSYFKKIPLSNLYVKKWSLPVPTKLAQERVRKHSCLVIETFLFLQCIMSVAWTEELQSPQHNYWWPKNNDKVQSKSPLKWPFSFHPKWYSRFIDIVIFTFPQLQCLSETVILHLVFYHFNTVFNYKALEKFP